MSKGSKAEARRGKAFRVGSMVESCRGEAEREEGMGSGGVFAFGIFVILHFVSFTIRFRYFYNEHRVLLQLLKNN